MAIFLSSFLPTYRCEGATAFPLVRLSPLLHSNTYPLMWGLCRLLAGGAGSPARIYMMLHGNPLDICRIVYFAESAIYVGVRRVRGFYVPSTVFKSTRGDCHRVSVVDRENAQSPIPSCPAAISHPSHPMRERRGSASHRQRSQAHFEGARATSAAEAR